MNKKVVTADWWGRDPRRWVCVTGWAHVRRWRRTQTGIRDIVRVRWWSHCNDNNPSTWTHSCREKFWKLGTLRLSLVSLSHANNENDFGRLIFANRRRIVYIVVLCTCKPVYTVVVRTETVPGDRSSLIISFS